MALSPTVQILISEFGLDRALAFCEKYSKTVLYIPSWSRLSTELRSVSLVTDSRKGMSIEELALKYGMSEDMVIRSLELSGEKWGLQEQNKHVAITCAICGGQFRQLTKSHLALHGITMKEYRERYPDNALHSERFAEAHKSFYEGENRRDISGDANPMRRPEVREKGSKGKKEAWKNPRKRKNFTAGRSGRKQDNKALETGRYGGKKARRKKASALSTGLELD